MGREKITITKRKAKGVLADMIANMDEDSLARTREKMERITEDYCSQEVVKLLKEKGFPFGYNKWVDEDAPTLISQSIVCKWLREVHELFVDISFIKDEDQEQKLFWYYAVFELSNDNAAHYNNADEFTTYEEAVEAALKYSLENLI